MIHLYLKAAFRMLVKHKGFSFINILGLSLGLTACLLIALFVRDERQFDQFIPEGDRVYRVYSEYTNNEGTDMRAVAPPMFATTLQQDFPQVERTLRVMMQPVYKRLFEAGKNRLYEDSGFYVDSTFFDLFPLRFTHGSPAGSLADPTSIVISEEMAKRFFGDGNPVGKALLMEKTPLQVKGVFRKDAKFHLPFNFLVPLPAAHIPQERMQSWGWHQFYHYLKVKKGTDIRALESRFQAVVKQKSAPFTTESRTADIPHFQPLRDVHLYSSSFKFDMALRGNVTYVRALTIVAIFILLIAGFNFVNLATAKSLQRAKEVGVRKSIGASRQQLMLQFTSETILLTLISTVTATGLTFLLLPWLNQFTEKHITFDLLHPLVLPLLLVLTGVVGVLAGFYPALVLSGFRPVKVLKGAVASDDSPGRTPWLRHGLVVVQFSLSVLLIISAIVVVRQVDYLHNKDLGLNREQIMFFPMRGDSMFRNYQPFKDALLQSPGVSSVSIGYGFPGDAVAGDNIIVSKDGEQKNQSATQLMVDYDYIKTLGLQVMAGRDFSEKMKTDQDQAFIINETAVRELGFRTPDDALGKTLQWPVWGAQNPDSLKTGRIIGVVKDFHYKSLYDKVETAVLQIYPDAYWKVAVKMKTTDVGRTVGAVQAVWNRFAAGYPIEYSFLDENFERMYQSEDKLRALLRIFTALTIFVACLGLFGLAAYAAERRRKEIGIRKVLGASVQGIVLLLSKDFVKLVGLSLLIASPVGWYLMNQWLEGFAYRISLSGWIFAGAGLLAVLIALLTVSFQAIRAARAKPLSNLRTE